MTNFRLKEIFIGADSYIGPNAYIVGGVSVGDSVAIGPHSMPVDQKQYSTDGLLWCGAPALNPIPWTNHNLLTDNTFDDNFTQINMQRMAVGEENKLEESFSRGGYDTFSNRNNGYTILHNLD